MVEVFIVHTTDRKAGIDALLTRSDAARFSGARVALKANFNSADPFPASTHLDTLAHLATHLQRSGAAELTLVERSGSGDTRRVLAQTGALALSSTRGFRVLVLDDAPRDAWVRIVPAGTHWLRGFYLPRVILDAEHVVQTCCLKTHRFGGHFTASLKNSVGLVAKKLPNGLYDYMWELHVTPHQRLKIAEINAFYDVDLVVMDAIKAFRRGGPTHGVVITPNVMLASSDRVAIDAVGVAVLRRFGSTRNVMRGRIFDLDQIRRAVELGVGVATASDIELVPVTAASRTHAAALTAILDAQG